MAAVIGFLLPGQGHVVEFVQTVKAGLDVINLRMPNHFNNYMKSPYGTCLKKQDEAVNRLCNLCLPMRVIRKSRLLLFQSGLVISVCIAHRLLKSARCNQDVLEFYFSQIRGLGVFYDHPLPTA